MEKSQTGFIWNYCNKKRIGFIVSDFTNESLFFHHSDILGGPDAKSQCRPGRTVRFDIHNGRNPEKYTCREAKSIEFWKKNSRKHKDKTKSTVEKTESS